MKILRWRITCVNYNNRCRVGQTLNVEMWILCLRWCGRPVKVTPASSKCSWKQVCTTFCHSASECVCVLSPVRTGDKVDCRRNRRQIQRSRLSPIRSTLSAVLAKNRQQLVADDIVANSVDFVASTVRSTLSLVCMEPKRHSCRLSTTSTVLNSTVSPVCTELMCVSHCVDETRLLVIFLFLMRSGLMFQWQNDKCHRIVCWSVITK